MNTISAIIGILGITTGLCIASKLGYRKGDHMGSRRGFARGIQVSRQIVSEVSRGA
jgi:hypothetical protein